MTTLWIIKVLYPFKHHTQIDAVRDQITKRKNGETEIRDPITNHQLLIHPVTKDNEKDFELCEMFLNSA